MIYIKTCAYNAEKTLRRAVDSVLNQTYRDFEYHILDNGSTDRTGELIREYAARDARIVPYYCKVNYAYQENQDFWNLSKRIPEGDYFCILDADDAYEPTFLREMLDFMTETHLELAACGTVFRDQETGAVLGDRVLPRNLLADTPERMDSNFPVIHWNLRQVWGKLYSSRAAAARYETDMPDWWPKAYGGDTINVMEGVKAAKGFGVYAKPLHNYFLSPKSVSYRWIPGREDADAILHAKTLEFLNTFCGRVSENNLCFLYCVYFEAFKDTVAVLIRAQLPLLDKLEALGRILAQPYTGEMLAADTSYYGVQPVEKQTLLRDILRWLELCPCTAQEAPALSAVYTALNPDFPRLIPAEQLPWYMAQAPKVVSSLAGGDYQPASRLLEDALSKHPLNSIPLELARTLAALFEDQGGYIAYSKQLIQALIREGDLPRAAAELSEWEAILPGDADLAKLRRLARGS